MSKIRLHVYVAKGATPTVADEINGPTVEVDEAELRENPEKVKQELINDFIGWLKGQPKDLAEFAVVEQEREGEEHFEKAPTLSRSVENAKAAIRAKHYGVVDRYKGFSVVAQRDERVTFRDKGGRFASRSRVEQA